MSLESLIKEIRDMRIADNAERRDKELFGHSTSPPWGYEPVADMRRMLIEHEEFDIEALGLAVKGLTEGGWFESSDGRHYRLTNEARWLLGTATE